MIRIAQFRPVVRRTGATLLASASALALAHSPAAAQEILYSSLGRSVVTVGERVAQAAGVTQLRLANGATLSFVDRAEYRLAADGLVDLYAGTVTVAGAEGAAVRVRMPGGVEGEVAGRGSAASFTVGAQGNVSGRALTGAVLARQGKRERRFTAGEAWASAGGGALRQVVSNGAQAVPNGGGRTTQPGLALREGGPVAAAVNGLPVSLGDQLAAAGASSDIVAAGRRVAAAAANPALDSFPSGDLGRLVAAAARLETANGGTPFPAAQADIIRTYLGYLADGGSGAQFLSAYAGLLGQYLDLLRAGALPSSFDAAGLADIDAFLRYSSRSGRLAALSSQDRALAQAYLAFLAGGGAADSFTAQYTDLVDAYFAFVRGGGDPLAFAGASQGTLDAYIAFLADSGLAAQLAAADRALLEAYLANGGLAFAGQYQAALDAYFAYLAAGGVPSAYADLDDGVLQAYLETLREAGLFEQVLGQQAGFYADYLAYLQAGGAVDAYPGLNANIFARYASQLQDYYAYLQAGGLPGGFEGDTEALTAYLAALQANGALDDFLGDAAGFYADYLAFAQTGAALDGYAGLNANIFAGYATALASYYDYLLSGGLPSDYAPLSQQQLAAYVAALEAQGASDAFLGELAGFYADYADYLASGADPDIFTGLPVLNLPAFAEALNAYAAFLAAGGLPSEFAASDLQTLANYLTALDNSGQLADLLGANAALLGDYFTYLAGGGTPDRFAGLPVYADYAAALNDYFAFLEAGGLPAAYSALTPAQIETYLDALARAGGLEAQLGELADFYTAYFAFVSAGGVPGEFAGLPVYESYAASLQAYFDFLAAGGLPADFTALTSTQVRAYLEALAKAGGLDAQIGGAAATFFADYLAFVQTGADPASFAGLPVYDTYVAALGEYYAFLAAGGLPGDYGALSETQVEAYLAALAGVEGGLGVFGELDTLFGEYYAFLAGGGDPADFTGLPVYADYLAAIRQFYNFLAAGNAPSAFTALTQEQVEAYLSVLSDLGLLAANFEGEVLGFYTDYLAFLSGGGAGDDYGGGFPTAPLGSVSFRYAGNFDASDAQISFAGGATSTGAFIQQFVSDSRPLTSADLEASGSLRAFTTNGPDYLVGTARSVEIFGNADVLIGRWTEGRLQLGTSTTPYDLSANQGLHYALTRRVPDTFELPDGLRVDYAIAAYTSPTMQDGSLAPGSIDGQMAVIYGRNAFDGIELAIGFEGAITMPQAGGDQVWDFTTPGGLANESGFLVSSDYNRLNQAFTVRAPAVVANGNCTENCAVEFANALAGEAGVDTLGGTYRTLGGPRGQNIGGALVWQNVDVPSSGGNGGGTDDGDEPSGGITESYLGGFASGTGRAYATDRGNSQPGSEAPVLDSAGALVSAGNLSNVDAQALDVAGDASGVIGRFADGRATFRGGTNSYGANGGLPYVVMAPITGTLPASGTIDYEVFARTRPTFSDGQTAPGTFDGTLSIGFGSQLTYRTAGTIVMPEAAGDVTYRFASTDYASGAFQNLLVAGPGPNDLFMSANVTGEGRGCVGSGCNIIFYGSFGGALPEERLGLVYQVYGGALGAPRIQGAVIYAPAAADPAAGAPAAGAPAAGAPATPMAASAAQWTRWEAGAIAGDGTAPAAAALAPGLERLALGGVQYDAQQLRELEAHLAALRQ